MKITDKERLDFIDQFRLILDFDKEGKIKAKSNNPYLRINVKGIDIRQAIDNAINAMRCNE